MPDGLCDRRDWSATDAVAAGEAIARISGDRAERMSRAADVLWDVLGDPSPNRERSAAGDALSWVGFYEIAASGNDHGGEPGSDMILGPHRDTPACSPIGPHGACGQSFFQNAVLIVRDVGALGEGYVACDPRDLSELVIPLTGDDGERWGVFDADSFGRGTFTEADSRVAIAFLVASGLTGPLESAGTRVIG